MLGRVIALTRLETVGATPIQLAGLASPERITLRGSSSIAGAFRLLLSLRHRLRPAKPEPKPGLRPACRTKLAAKPTPAKAPALMRMGSRSGVLGN